MTVNDEVSWLNVYFSHIVYCVALKIESNGKSVLYDKDLILRIKSEEMNLTLYQRIGDIHVYSISADPNNIQGINLGKVYDIELGFNGLKNGTYNINIMSIHSNLLRQLSGMARLAYN